MALEPQLRHRVRALILIAPCIFTTAAATAAAPRPPRVPRPPRPSRKYLQPLRTLSRISRDIFLRGLLQPLTTLIVGALIGSGAFWKRGVSIAYHQPSKLSSEMVARYRWPAQVRGASRGLASFVGAQLEGPPPEELAESDLASELARRGIPTLIIHGMNDRMVPIALSRGLQRRQLQNATLVALDECGHVPHEEWPKEVSEIIADFLVSEELL